MSEDGGLEEVEESFRAAASCAWRRATVASSAFNRASRASNSACKRRQFGQDFRALAFIRSSVVGSSDVNVTVSRPVLRFRLASMSTYTPSVAVASTRVLYDVRPGGTLTT